jgi:hypothetical protein
MNRYIANALGITGIIALGILSWALWQWGKTGQVLSTQTSALSSTQNSLNKTLVMLNGPTGTIAEVNKLLLALKSTTVHIDLAARHEDQQLTVLDAQERQLFADTHGTLGELKNTATALTGTAQAATATLGEGQKTIRAAQPLLASFTESGDNLNVLLKRQAITQFVDNLGPLSQNLVAITGVSSDMLTTADQVERKATNSYLHPSHNVFVRVWQTASPFVVAGAKITATVF